MSDRVDQVPSAEPFELTITGHPDAPSTYAFGFHPMVVRTIAAVTADQACRMNQPVVPREVLHVVTEAVASGLEHLAAFLRAVDRDSASLRGLPSEEARARIRALEVRYLAAAPAPPSGCVAEGEERDGCVRRGYCWRPTPCT